MSLPPLGREMLPCLQCDILGASTTASIALRSLIPSMQSPLLSTRTEAWVALTWFPEEAGPGCHAVVYKVIEANSLMGADLKGDSGLRPSLAIPSLVQTVRLCRTSWDHGTPSYRSTRYFSWADD